MIKFRKGDTVKITAGKDKGQTGKVEQVLPGKLSLVVTGKNVYKKHTKAREQGQSGGIVDKFRPLSFSKVALICPKCQQPTRIGWQLTKDKKWRWCRKCHQPID